MADGPHSHASDPAIAAGDAAANVLIANEAQARITADAALDARLKVLEGGSPPPPPPPPPSGGLIGPGIGFTDLANTSIDASQNPNFYRFRAGQSAGLTSILFYIIANGNTGYANGNGGTYKITLQPVDASGFPTGTVLATANQLTTGNPSKPMITVTFPSPFTTVSGTLYALVFTNTDPNPATNYWSLDGLYVPHSSPYLPKYPDTDWAWGYRNNGSSWYERTEQVPCLDIGYSNGQHDGVGYMETSRDSGGGGVISGANQVSDLFTASVSRSCMSAGVYLRRTSGSDPLIVTIGGVSASIPAASIPVSSDYGDAWWVSVPLAVSIAAGQQYRFVLSCAGSSTYKINPIRSGVGSYGFSLQTVFGGNAQQSSDGGKTWSSLGRVPNQNDLPFYLR